MVSRISLLIICLALAVSACSGKSITKPRSQIISEAAEAGVVLPAVEQDRARFLDYQRDQEKRLLNLVRQRAQGKFRNVNYTLGTGDEVEVHVFDVPELDGTVRVLPSGFISLPLIGAVQASGLNESELKEAISAKLKNFVKHPEVNLFISFYGSQNVAVLGAVKTPGTYPLKKGENSVLELLSSAGGLNEKAGNFLDFVPAELSGLEARNDVEARAQMALASYEQVNSRKHAIEIALDKVLGTAGGIPLEIPVRGGDMLIIPEAGTVTVEGEVEKTGSYPLTRGMTLLGSLAAAGGIGYSAKVDEIEIVRELAGEDKLRLVVNLERIATGEDRDVRLKNGDIVRVPSESGRRLGQDTFEGLSRIINFGIGGSVSLVP